MESTQKPTDPSYDDVTRRLCNALTEIASASKEDARRIVLRLLQTINTYTPILRLAATVDAAAVASVLGITDDELYEIYRKAHRLNTEDQCEESLALCKALLVLTPGHGAVLALMASCCVELARYEEALGYIDQAIGASGDGFDYYLQRAYILYRLGQMEEAATALRDILERDPQQATDEAQRGRRLLAEISDILGG